MSTEDIEHIRQQGREILSRLQSDPAFQRQVQENPQATLTAAGLPESAADDFIVEVSRGGEVQGFCTSTCPYSCRITCILTDSVL